MVVENPWDQILDMKRLPRARRGAERGLERLKKLMSSMFEMTWLHGSYQVEIREPYHECVYIWIWLLEINGATRGARGFLNKLLAS